MVHCVRTKLKSLRIESLLIMGMSVYTGTYPYSASGLDHTGVAVVWVLNFLHYPLWMPFAGFGKVKLYVTLSLTSREARF